MSTLTGLGHALRLTLRRNWLFWVVWIVVLSMLMPATFSQYDTIIPPGTDPRTTLEPLVHNATMLAILGPAFDIYDKGGFIFWRVGGFTCVLAGLMAGFGIIRATRVEEEAGRVELLRSGRIGRHAPLAAGVIVSLAGCLVLGAVNAASLIGLGLAVPGSIAAGLAIGLTGMLYVGFGAVAAQVFESSRSTRAWAVGLGLGGLYLARAIVDGSFDRLAAWRWVIPLEWGMLSRPFADERWWVFALPAGLTALCLVVAFWLESKRDHGSGLLSASRGRATAPASLGNVWGLTARLQRTSLIAWSASILVCAVAFGSIAIGMDQVFADNPDLGVLLERMGGTAQLTMAFVIGVLGILVTLLAVMAVGIMGQLQSTEDRGQAELLLASGTSRTSLAASHLLWALVVPALLAVGAGAGLVTAQAADQGDWGLLGDYAATGAAMIPGLVLVVGLAMLLIGWAPRAFGLIWAVIGWSIFCSWFSILFDLPDWVVRAQPWGHLSLPPRDTMDWTPFLVELAIGLVLIVLGLVGYRRRDIHGR